MTREAASADTMMAEHFPADLKRIIEGGDYGAKQVFNVEETGIFCTHTYLRKRPGFKAAKDSLALLLGGNAEGDIKLKPMLIYHSANPTAFKGFSKTLSCGGLILKHG